MNKNIPGLLILTASILSTTFVLAQTAPSSKPGTAPAKSGKPDSAQAEVGQKKFQANCGRCHTFPEQLSPSITGTVVRHMRVRANLSAQDEKDILRFLAP